MTRLTLRNGAYSSYDFDEGGRLTRLDNRHSSGLLKTGFQYMYDANSNITRIEEDFNGSPVTSAYAYDALDRLTREASPSLTKRYYYDAAGNRTRMEATSPLFGWDGDDMTEWYEYDAAHRLTKRAFNHRIQDDEEDVYAWDNAGRLTKLTCTREVDGSDRVTKTTEYGWDARDSLTRAHIVGWDEEGSNPTFTKTLDYTYNADGLRVRRVDADNGGSGGVTKLYQYQGNNLAAIQTNPAAGTGGENDWVYTVAPGAISNALERHQPNYVGGTTESYYYQYDHRGNVVAVSDAEGEIERGYRYDAFGNVVFSFQEGGSGGPPPDGAALDDILFTGKDLDADTGLYYFNARWYDPGNGRFVSRDPAFRRNGLDASNATGIASSYPHRLASFNGYVFCQNNPMRYIDPSGGCSSGPTIPELEAALAAGKLAGRAFGLTAGDPENCQCDCWEWVAENYASSDGSVQAVALGACEDECVSTATRLQKKD